jgi:hypothetical protein
MPFLLIFQERAVLALQFVAERPVVSTMMIPLTRHTRSRPKRASHDSQTATLAAATRRTPLISNALFYHLLCPDISLRLKRLRHQLAQSMARQKIIHGAVACGVPNLLFISQFHFSDV